MKQPTLRTCPECGQQPETAFYQVAGRWLCLWCAVRHDRQQQEREQAEQEAQSWGGLFAEEAR